MPNAIMRIFQRLFRQQLQLDRPSCDRETELQSEWVAEIGYQRLEPRRVLSATFLFDEGLLALSGFDDGQDLSFSQTESSSDDLFVFEIEDGNFANSGDANPQILLGPGTLTVPVSLVSQGISIDGNNSIGITQNAGTREFATPNLEVANFELVDQSLSLSNIGTIGLRDLSVDDSDPADTSDVEISVQASSINISGNVANLSASLTAGSLFTADGPDGSINIDGGAIQSAAGNISLVANEQIIFTEAGSFSSSISSQSDGDISLTAGNIFMDDSSSIEAADGDVTLTADGTDLSDIVLGRIETTGEININSTGAIVDGTTDELANLIADRLDIAADSIGATDDIETQVNLISFSASQTVQITDLADGVVVNTISSAGGGSLVASGSLTIEANVTLSESFTFIASNSPDSDDTIRIVNDAIILLDAPTDEMIELVAGDDIFFDTGRIETVGAGTHSVLLTADNEASLDSNRGSIVNALGSIVSVTTNRLVIDSGDGVGQTGNGLRTNVDSFQAVNSFDNDIVIVESDGVVIDDLTNSSRGITLAAGGFIQINGQINAGSIQLLAQGDVVQSNGSVIDAESIGIVQQSNSLELSNDLDANGRFDIVLDQDNRFSVVAASNSFDGGVVAFATTNDLTIGQIDSVEVAPGIEFPTTAGLTTTSTNLPVIGPSDGDAGDIFFQSGGSVEINESIVAGNGDSDIRIIANGNLTQNAAGIIVANELGFRQESVGIVQLTADNDFDVLAGFNASGNVLIAGIDELTVGNVSGQSFGELVFAATNGLTGADVLLQSTSSLRLESGIDSGTDDVFLIANGDIAQSPTGVIQANQLGIRQEAALFDSVGDTDSNNRFGILLPAQNDVNVLAAFNAFDGGTIAIADNDDLTVDRIDQNITDGIVFNETVGISTTFSGANTSGSTDTSDADILVQAGSQLIINQPIVAGSGTTDVRLVAQGDIRQLQSGLIAADELGVQQTSNSISGTQDDNENGILDIQLFAGNQVGHFGATNSFNDGEIQFNNSAGFTVDSISESSVDGISFEVTDGLTSLGGELFLNSNGFIDLASSIETVGGTVRIHALGDVTQASGQGVTAAEFGIRQLSDDLSVTDDLDNNGRFEIILDGSNDVDSLAAFNVFDQAVIAFNTLGKTDVGIVSGVNLASSSFVETAGIVSAGDILLQSAGAINIMASLDANTGSGDVRIQSSGDIVQSASAPINADRLAVRQVGEFLVVASDLDQNGSYDVSLDAVNSVNTFATSNVLGDVTIVNGSALSIGAIESQVADQLGFPSTSGADLSGNLVVETLSGSLQVNSNVVSEITAFDSAGAIELTAAVNSAEVVLVSNGDIIQSDLGFIDSDLLGVFQGSSTLNPLFDLDGNGTFDIVLDAANSVDTFAAQNNFTDGVVAFSSIENTSVGTVGGFVFGEQSFPQIVGVVSEGNILLEIDGSLRLDESISAATGSADVRLIANGDITQGSNATITANQLGVRSDGNDVLLESNNQVNTFSAFNPLGAVNFVNGQSLAIGVVGFQQIGNIVYAESVGVDAGSSNISTIDGNLFIDETIVIQDGNRTLLQSGGSIALNDSLSAAEVRLIANGDILQTPASVISASLLGVRQEATELTLAGDRDPNGQFDVILDGENTVDQFAALNAFDLGVVAFNNATNFAVGSVNAFVFEGANFNQTTGITALGDVAIESGGEIRILQTIDAAIGSTDVRIVANGDILQELNAPILANALGVRQESDSLNDIVLNAPNALSSFAASNPLGNIELTNSGSLVVQTVVNQSIDSINFTETFGINSGQSVIIDLPIGNLELRQQVVGDESVLLESAGSILIDTTIESNEVRLIAHGDIVQFPEAAIESNLLGVRQQGVVFDPSADFDDNGSFDIVLDANNTVDVFASFNAFEGGVVGFRNLGNLDVGAAPATTLNTIEFTETLGVVTTNELALESGDILLESGGFVDVREPITAGGGNSDLRIIANGDVNQVVDATIMAVQLGVRIESGTFVNDNDLDDGNDSHDVTLEEDNLVSEFAALNEAGSVNFNNAQSLVIGTVQQQTIGVIEFATTEGIMASNIMVSSTDGSLGIDDALVVLDGDDLLLQSAGAIFIDEELTAPNVRVSGGGDVFQSAAGRIVTESLGIRIDGLITSGENDLDSNGRLDVLLDSDNDTDTLAIANFFDEGVIAFNDVDDLTIGNIPAISFNDFDFAETDGLLSTLTQSAQAGAADLDIGDILLRANGEIRIESPVIAGNNPGTSEVEGNADLRIIASGDISQSASGIVSANELGIRVQAADSARDVLLDSNNEVSVLSAENESAGGVFVFNDADEISASRGLVVGTVSEQTFGLISFDQVGGVVTTFTGPAIAGATDGDQGDVLIVAGGFLQLNEPVSSGDGNSDIRIMAFGDIGQSQNGAIIANELGVHQTATFVIEGSDFDGDQSHAINFGIQIDGTAINDVDIVALLNQDSQSNLSYRDQNAVTIGSISTQTFGSASFFEINGIISDDGQTTENFADGSGDIVVTAMTTLNDADGVPIATGGSAVLRGDSRIELANQANDQINVAGNVLFQSSSISVGQDSQAAGAAGGNVTLGSLTIDGLGNASSSADITEDDDIVLTSQTLLGTRENRTDLLVLTSGGDISNDINTTLRVDQAQLNAEAGNVFLGNQNNDLFTNLDNPEIELGVNSNNASIAAESSIQINGLAPSIDNAAANLELIGSFGTKVAQTLFVDSSGHVRQISGSLDTSQLGIQAAEHVQLEQVDANNQSLAVAAGDASAAANLSNHQGVLDQLQAIQGSEVNPELIQSISISHEDILSVGLALNPDENGETNSIAGVSSAAINHGSIFLNANESIVLNQSVTGTASNSLPQVTVYAENSAGSLGSSDDANQITFASGASIRVEGAVETETTNAPATNFGIVNAAQTVAFFGTDENDNGAIDTFFFDQNQNNVFDTGELEFETTSIISLDSTSTAEQLIQAIYGNQGEEGYRLAFVFDSERRFDPAFADSQEVPNIYTANGSTDTESFDVLVQSILESPSNFMVLSPELTFQTEIIEQSTELDGQSTRLEGPFNFNSTFEKVEPFTSESLSQRTDNTFVFTTAEVRNDQDINLFVGSDASNALNAVSATLEAQIETMGLPPTSPEFTFSENSVPEIVFPTRPAEQISIVDRAELPDVAKIERPGKLSLLAVKIDDPENNISVIDDELVLNNPLGEYQPLESGEKPEELEGLSRNQYEKIKAAIEADPNNEVGYWYKVFIDNASKKDDLLFYYYKTGENQNADGDPNTDFAPSESNKSDGLDEPSTKISPDQGGESTYLLNDETHAEKVEPPETESIAEPVPAALPFSIMLSTLAGTTQRKPTIVDANSSSSKSEFARLHSLKQQWKELLQLP